MGVSKNCQWKNGIQAAVWLFPILFLIDDILGFNGYQFTIGGKSIRIILFCLSVAVLCGYCIYIIWAERISVLPGRNREKSLWKLFTVQDWFVFLFIFGNLLWATVIPLLVRGEMIFALKDYSTILVLVLYFPLAFLIRTGRLNLRFLEKLIYGLILVLAAWHCVMYIGDSLHPGFYAAYYDFIDVISFGTALRSDVVYGFGIIRIIQVTSLLLLPGIFLSIRYILAGQYVHFLPLLLLTFAICVTYTKSIWFGYILGLFVYLIPSAILSKKLRARSIVTLLAAAVMICALNYTVFQNTIFTRAFNTVRSDESIAELQSQLAALQQKPTTDDNPAAPDAENNASGPTISAEQLEQQIQDKQNELWDAKGTQESNALRTAQINALLNKWKESKLLGFGYGSYTEDCIRSSSFPYMYEATLPALIMKVGLAGIPIWAALIIAATITACAGFWKENRCDVFWWLGTGLAYGLAVQTNPFLFTFSGFSILLYLLLSTQKKKALARS